MKKEDETQNVPDFMVISAARYAYERGTYITPWTQDWLEENWDELSEHVRSVIVRDIEHIIDIYRDIGRGPIRGQDIDRWRDLHAKWTENDDYAPLPEFQWGEYDFEALKDRLDKYDNGTRAQQLDAQADIEKYAIDTARELDRAKDMLKQDYPVIL